MPKKPVAPITTREGCIRLLQERDLDETRAWRNQDHIRKWFRSTQQIEAEQHRAWFRSYSQKENDYTFVIEFRGIPVGQIALYNFDQNDLSAEIGRIVIGSSQFSGRGLAREAVEALLHLAKNFFGLQKVRLEVRSDNDRAIALYDRCGFVVTRADDEFTQMEYHVPSLNQWSAQGAAA